MLGMRKEVSVSSFYERNTFNFKTQMKWTNSSKNIANKTYPRRET